MGQSITESINNYFILTVQNKVVDKQEIVVVSTIINVHIMTAVVPLL